MFALSDVLLLGSRVRIPQHKDHRVTVIADTNRLLDVQLRNRRRFVGTFGAENIATATAVVAPTSRSKRRAALGALVGGAIWLPILFGIAGTHWFGWENGKVILSWSAPRECFFFVLSFKKNCFPPTFFSANVCARA